MTCRSLRNLGATAAALALAAGCARPLPTLAPSKPTEVLFDTPVVQDVTEYEDFTGRTEAVAAVDVRARVTGYLQEIHFKDGTDVQKGDLLFVIDPTPYQAELDRAKAQLLLAEARVARLEKDQKRVTGLAGRGVSQAEVDLIFGDLAEARATVKVAEAATRLAQQNLDWTRVTAPISGRLSRRMIDAGNLVKADDTILTSLVALDTVYTYFDVDERTLLRIRRLIREGKVYSARQRPTHVQVGLADEDGFSQDGVIDFIDNKIDAGTGTLRVRATVDNHSQNTSRLFSPGLFVRIRLPIGNARSAILVPEEAIGTDQGQKYVYVLTAKDDGEKDKPVEAQYRPVRLGQQFDRYRVVEEGLSPGERVIVSGLQRVRPGAKVAAKPGPKTPAPKMPELKPQDPPNTTSVKSPADNPMRKSDKPGGPAGE